MSTTAQAFRKGTRRGLRMAYRPYLVYRQSRARMAVEANTIALAWASVGQSLR